VCPCTLGSKITFSREAFAKTSPLGLDFAIPSFRGVEGERVVGGFRGWAACPGPAGGICGPCSSFATTGERCPERPISSGPQSDGRRAEQRPIATRREAATPGGWAVAAFLAFPGGRRGGRRAEGARKVWQPKPRQRAKGSVTGVCSGDEKASVRGRDRIL
jgi:hypothetical protein